MNKTINCNIKFDATTLELFENMGRIAKEHKIKRLNDVILLQALLEENNSVFYECLATIATASVAANPYKGIISDCKQKLKEISRKEKNISFKEKPFVIKMQDDELKFFLSEEFQEILYYTYRIVISEMLDLESVDELEDVEPENFPTEEVMIDSTDIFIAFMDNIPKNSLSILKNNGVYLEGIREIFNVLEDMFVAEVANESDTNEETNKLPMAISDFAKILTTKYKNGMECEYLGRDKECSKIMRILQKRGKKNAILIGEPGVGKTAIAEKIAHDIAVGNCPESLKNHIVIQVDVNSSVAGTMYRGMAEERFKHLVEYLNTHDNVILFIDEIHMVIGAGATSGNDAGNMSNALKPFLASEKAKVIGATTQKEYELHFSKDDAFKRRFEEVYVKEPKSKEVYPMLKKAIEAHEKFHGVKIEKDMVDYAILISSCFDNNTHNPDRTNDLIDCAMVIAKEKQKEYVDRESILENFNINFEQFEKLEEVEKVSTAYHEAGHYLVCEKSDKLKDYKSIAISIMPTESYLGITVWDDLRDEVTVYPDKEYFIDCIARMLAGRVAEKIYTKNISSGATSDLEKANKIAYEVISKYGMSEKFGNRIYIENAEYHMMSEKIRDEINEEVRELINKGTKRAEEIISQNESLLKKIVDELLKKPILDENDLERICNE